MRWEARTWILESGIGGSAPFKSMYCMVLTGVREELPCLSSELDTKDILEYTDLLSPFWAPQV